MTNEFLQIREFINYSSSSAEGANEFLKEIGSRVVSVNHHYNTILGGIEYVVVYWNQVKKELEEMK